MSVVISYCRDNFSIILADKRLSYGKNQEYGYRDDNDKLIDVPGMGWCSGTGFASFLDEFQERLIEDRNTHLTFEELQSLFQESIIKMKKADPGYEDDIETSVIVFSTLAKNNKNQISTGNFILSHRHYGEGMGYYLEEEIRINYPSDFTELGRGAYVKLKSDNAYEILGEMLKVFKEVASNSKYVSKTCDIGFVTLEGNVLSKLKLSGDVDELMNDLMHDRINSKLELVNRVNL